MLWRSRRLAFWRCCRSVSWIKRGRGISRPIKTSSTPKARGYRYGPAHGGSAMRGCAGDRIEIGKLGQDRGDRAIRSSDSPGSCFGERHRRQQGGADSNCRAEGSGFRNYANTRRQNVWDDKRPKWSDGEGHDTRDSVGALTWDAKGQSDASLCHWWRRTS
jgi:hypothetical protein